MQAPQDVVLPTVKHGFEDSRRKLVETFGELVFLRVAVVSFPKNDVRAGVHYQGEAIEVFAGRSSRAPRVAFFSRFGRQTGIGFSLLGITIVDTPLGMNHASATPQVGDILVGSLMPAAKGKLPFEVRGWSSGGKPLIELARIIQFGTRMAEAELKRMLRQPAAETANSLLRLSVATLSPTEIAHAKQASACADELWVLVRIVCFGNLDDPGGARLGGKSFVDMVDMIATRFGDEVLLDEWSKKRPPPPVTTTEYAWAPPPTMWGGTGVCAADGEYTSKTPISHSPKQYASPPSSPKPVNLASFLSKLSAIPPVELYDPTKHVARVSNLATEIVAPASPTYAPASPTYAPASPTYAPASPKKSPVKKQKLDFVSYNDI